MIDLRKLVVFAAVVENQGFSAASPCLGMTRSAASRNVAELEEELGVRLLNRTTRRIGLTTAGEVFYRTCASIIEQAREATATVRELQGLALGTLRLTLPLIADVLVTPPLKEFMELHPRVKVDLVFDDRFLPLVDSNLDLALRIGPAGDSRPHTRRLAKVPQVVVGSPDYLKRAGVPKSPEDLADHEWVAFSGLEAPWRLTFSRGETRKPINLSGRLQINGPALREALRQGLGLGLLPAFFAARELGDGSLRAVLTDYVVKPTSLYVVYPGPRPTTKAQILTDFLASRLADVPHLLPES